MSWLAFALFGFLVDASASIIDKGLLGSRKVRALSYTYFTGITSIGVALVFPLLHWVAIVLASVGIAWPMMLNFSFTLLPTPLLVLALLSGITFLGGLYFFYRCLELADPVRVVPLVYGMVTPILTLGFAWFFAGDVLFSNEIVAFVLFIIGGLFLMLERGGGQLHLNRSLALFALFAGLFFATSFALTRALYTASDNFLLAFVWARLGSVLGGLLLLALPHAKGHAPLKKAHRGMGGATWAVLLGNKVLGAIGFLSFNFALSSGPAALVNALAGTKYFFVFALTLMIPVRYRSYIVNDGNMVIQKLFGVLIIGVGVYVLYYFNS